MIIGILIVFVSVLADPTATTGMSGSTLVPRPLSFVSSFAQTENDASGGIPLSADMVDLGVMPMTIAEAADEVFLSVPNIMDEDCHMSDASSLYHAFDEVYEMDERNMVNQMEEVCPYPMPCACLCN